ncbi:Uncharacterized protein APZ42_020202 [Daphnia magna]|uniref:Uncharacterized protein n=1 Tax=Daphnia magna TaxID=35525 RepID=A0A164Y1R4_9CRUS|nr:Uncharacterized protein APZ42_020202 [Daphnia magna]
MFGLDRRLSLGGIASLVRSHSQVTEELRRKSISIRSENCN